MTATASKPGELVTTNKIDELMRAGCPIICVQTHEEERFLRYMKLLAQDQYHKEKPLYLWSRASGLRKVLGGGVHPGQPAQKIENTFDPIDVVDAVRELDRGIVVLCDFGPYLAPGGQEDSVLCRLVRELAFSVKTKVNVHVLICGAVLPEIPSLEKELEVIDLPLPTLEEVHAMLDYQLGQLQKHKIDVTLTHEGREKLEGAVLGLTHTEIEAAISKATVHFGRVRDEALPLVIEEKRNIIRRSGALEYLEPKDESSIGGYEHLRHLLHQSAVTFTPEAREFGVEPSKGLLLVGLPGTGKDLAMQVAGSVLGRPIVRMDMGAVMGEGGGIIGQAEMSMKRALGIASTMQGILGISEFEKGTGGAGASGQLDAGTTARTISILLNWMQEQQGVFVFATANDVRGLAPEQLRQGRFEQVVFVDLPTLEERAAIFGVHLAKRKRNPEQFDLLSLAEVTGKATGGTGDFSGAEIEAVVKGALVDALMQGDKDITGDHLIKRARGVKPLSVVRAQDIAEIREWARVHLSAESANGAHKTESGSGLAGETDERVIQI